VAAILGFVCALIYVAYLVSGAATALFWERMLVLLEQLNRSMFSVIICLLPSPKNFFGLNLEATSECEWAISAEVMEA
jgi:hypothetical protein